MALAVVPFSLAVMTGCGPRTTFDRFDTVAFAPVKVEAAARVRDKAKLAHDLASAIGHYVTADRLFKAVDPDAERRGATTLVIEPTVLSYTPASGAPLSLLGGRARGSARICYTFKDREGKVLHEEELSSCATTGGGTFIGVPPPLGGVDATVEGAALSLDLWMRRNKSNPGAASAPEVARRPTANRG